MDKIKRVGALAIVAILIILYAVAFVSAFFTKEGDGTMFNIAITATIFLPILLYIFMFTASWLKGRGVKNNSDDTEDK